jgi:toxin ParE1/3/4
MVKIKWTDNALHDLKSVFDYIAKDSQKYANIQVKKIKERTNLMQGR